MVNETFNEYSSWYNLDIFAYNCISFLMLNNENIWKLLYYMEPNALNQSNLTQIQKASLVYKGEPDSSNFRVFTDGGNNDAFGKHCSILKVYPAILSPTNHIVGTTSMMFEILTHYKVNTLNNYSNRSITILKEIIKTLNGISIEGLGRLFFSRKGCPYDKAQFNLNNEKSFFGYSLIMSTQTA